MRLKSWQGPFFEEVRLDWLLRSRWIAMKSVMVAGVHCVQAREAVHRAHWLPWLSTWQCILDAQASLVRVLCMGSASSLGDCAVTAQKGSESTPLQLLLGQGAT